MGFTFRLVQYCAQQSLSTGTNPEFSIGSAISNSSKVDECLDAFRQEYLEPFYEFIDSQLDQQMAVLSLLVKYKRKVEWFEREQLAEMAGKDERQLARHLYFVNKPEEILASFQPYYRTAALEDVTDPNIVHELQIKLDKAKVYFQTEVDAFAEAFFDPKRKQAGLHAHLKPASDRFGELDEEDAEQFRKDLGSFLRLYDFLSQIINYEDADLEKLYVFGKNLMPRIAEQGAGSSILELDSDVRLTHYRLQKLGEQKLDLASGEIVKLKPLSEVGTGTAVDDERRKLSEIVEKMNDLFAGNLSEADMVGYVTTIKGKLLESEILAEQAENNTEQQFLMGDFKDVLTDIIIEGQGAHNSIADQLLKDDRIFAAMQGMLAKMVFQAFAQRRAAP